MISHHSQWPAPDWHQVDEREIRIDWCDVEHEWNVWERKSRFLPWLPDRAYLSWDRFDILIVTCLAARKPDRACPSPHRRVYRAAFHNLVLRISGGMCCTWEFLRMLQIHRDRCYYSPRCPTNCRRLCLWLLSYRHFDERKSPQLWDGVVVDNGHDMHRWKMRVKTKHSPINQISGIHYQSIVSHARRSRRRKSSSWGIQCHEQKSFFLCGIATKRMNTTVDKNHLLSSSEKGIESFHFLVQLSTIMIRRPVGWHPNKHTKIW